jgi:putative NIF3 family GTP cyclohydrolase 1 type 2
MKAYEVLNRLTKAARPTDTWSKGEPYGAYNLGMYQNIDRAVYCVTPTPEVIAAFKAGKHDVLISHHPYVTDVPQIVLHTALDCCEGGLNDQWRDALGIKNARHFDRNLGWYGQVDPISYKDMYAKISKYIGRAPLGTCFSDIPTIGSVAVCSGLGGMVESEAFKNTHADCYIMGEGVFHPHWSPFKAQFEVGHTLSEFKPGMLFLRKHLPEISVYGANRLNDYFGHEVYTTENKGYYTTTPSLVKSEPFKGITWPEEDGENYYGYGGKFNYNGAM